MLNGAKAKAFSPFDALGIFRLLNWRNHKLAPFLRLPRGLGKTQMGRGHIEQTHGKGVSIPRH